MRLFLDANILVAVLNKEYPIFDTAARVLSLGAKKEITLFTSPICLAIAFYFAEKKLGSKRAKTKIEILCKHLEIAETTRKSIQSAITNKQVLELEDGFEYYAALDAKCTHIISENVGDFYFSKIPVMNSRDFLLQLTRTK